ncbi:PEP-CTERM sorting domain-containing protein [Emcibacter nanhaiensis]|uniref:PEP-CTERM sorting domain-containing protein n=1 Tax=Emcibacter nanhaiensis TaxID=1505037 RepID=A0A501PRA8_9PROT|nr:PEP-CTERM sorting domain-containing protein [Emcibacter nanhaiensis]TPD63060.1 PEP-CTERM sorting domain-containing protein [Emcibacter nanhaiensis]
MSNIIRKIAVAVAIAGSMFLGAQGASATALDVGTTSGGGCCSFGTRGFWFEAPTDFTITGLSLPLESVQDSTLEVVLFNSTPPTYTNTTNDFTSLGYWEDVLSVETNLYFETGDIIGILGWADGRTPYNNTGGDYASSLGGFSITLSRLGFQDLGMAYDLWTEDGTIGVINVEYELGQVGDVDVSEPAQLALLGFALVGFGLMRRRKTA